MKYPRTVNFPSDTKERAKYFASAEKGHPARANLWMMEWLIKKLTKPGDTILDPCSGVGTLMYATLLGRNVVNIELEHHFIEIQQLTWAKLCNEFKPTGTFTLLEGDARRYLPVKADHSIFSPPYSVNISKGGAKVLAMAIEAGTSVAEYGQNRAQLARLDYFNLLIAMKEIYRGIYNSLPDNAYLCTITKDSVNTKAAKYRGYGGIEPYSADTLRACHEIGFKFAEWWLRDAKPSLRLQVAWKQNPTIPKVRTEDIIILRR